MLLLNRPLVLFVATFLSLWFAAWAGTLIRSRRPGFPEGSRSDYTTIVGATLTLLGLLIGFTFSMAITRYDLRKSLEEEEANAIGTEYARLDLLAGGAPAGLKNLLRQYTDLRIRFYESRYGSNLQQINVATAKMQNQLWVVTSTAAKVQPSPLSALVSSGMNDVLNAQGYTQAAWWNRIPAAAWCLMFLIAVLSNVLIGYGAHARALTLSLILPLAVAISFFLIADIDSPRGGVIRVQPQNLYVLEESFQAP
jgi:hypothetical protein